MLETGFFFNEFVVQGPRPPAEINRALLGRRIVGGYDLGRAYPQLEGCMLLAATEINSRNEIDRLATALGEAAAPGGGVL